MTVAISSMLDVPGVVLAMPVNALADFKTFETGAIAILSVSRIALDWVHYRPRAGFSARDSSRLIA